MDETKKERFLRILSKLEKKITIPDPEGNPVEFAIGYPSWRNSELFWDTIHTVITLQREGEDKLTNAESIDMLKQITPKVIGYILNYMEIKNKCDLEDEEKEYYYITLQMNIEAVVGLFMDMTTKMLNITGDVPKNLRPLEASKTE